MAKIWLCSLVLLVLVKTNLSDDEEDCSELFKSLTKPRDCCNYPMRHILSTHQEKCKKACSRIKDETGGCCFLNCNYFETGVIKHQEFNEKALLELYENYLEDKGAGKFDQWMPVIANSIKKCAEFIPKSSKMFACNIPEHVLDIMDCVDHSNFLNCPNFVNSTQCNELKNFINKPSRCGKEVNGNFIIDYKFFDVSE